LTFGISILRLEFNDPTTGDAGWKMVSIRRANRMVMAVGIDIDLMAVSLGVVGIVSVLVTGFDFVTFIQLVVTFFGIGLDLVCGFGAAVVVVVGEGTEYLARGV